MRSHTIAAALAIALITATPASYARTVQDFASRMQVSVPAGTSVARVALPAATFASTRTADGGDLRVFNEEGQLLPYALINAATQPQTRPDTQGTRLIALPILGERATASGNASTLRIIEGDGTGKRRVIEYSSPNDVSTSRKASAVADVRGLLFDSRSLDSEIRAVELEGALPAATVVKITLSASPDLTNWRVLSLDAPIYEFPATEGSASGPGNRRVSLPAGTNLKDQYLRLTWSGVSAAPAIVALRTIGVGEAATVPPVTVDLGAPTGSGSSDEAVQWTLPNAYRVQALRLATAVPNALMPVRVSTRARAGEPWRTVTSSVVYRLTGADGVTSVNPAQPLAYALKREVRVEAMPGYRLTGVPLTLSLEFAPLHVLFVATGKGPFTVASGKAGLASAALPVATLMPGYRAGDEFKLPLLAATGGASADPFAAGNKGVTPGMTGNAPSDWLNRTTILWSVLVLAVLVLGGLALMLLRSPTRRE
jgi:Protein of unknown function (DUF3999)